eukprot:gene4342-20557_t
MFKVLGRANLSLQELKEIMLDVEIALNNRPLCYVEDDIQLPELTPNIMLLGHHNSLINEEARDLQNKDLRKRAKYLEKCKQNLWKRWTNEYVRGLRERHNLTNRGKEKTVSERDVVLIHADDKNKGKWRWSCQSGKSQNKKDSCRKSCTAIVSIGVSMRKRKSSTDTANSSPSSEPRAPAPQKPPPETSQPPNTTQLAESSKDAAAPQSPSNRRNITYTSTAKTTQSNTVTAAS